MTTEPSLSVSEKVYSYITQGEELLVFRHVDFPDAGIQVPGGTVKPGEALSAAALREAFEETGLHGLYILAELGETWFGMADYGRPGDVHHRHFFHLRSDATIPSMWRHEERDPADGGAPFLFEFSWIPIADAPDVLIAELGALCHRLRANPPRDR